MTSDTNPAIDDPQEDLLRQVHPVQVQEDGTPASSAFYPRPPDNGCLSTRRQHIGAKRAFEEWSANHDSVGTWGIRTADLPEGVTAFDDSAEEGMPEGHASIDFREVPTSRHRKIGRKVRDASETRGRLHP